MNIFNIFKQKKPQQKPVAETEYSFIWYKEMMLPNKIIYTQPFRTVVKASSYAEAREKLEKVVLNKTKLVIVLEDKFNKTDLGKFNQTFDDMQKTFGDIIDKLNKF